MLLADPADGAHRGPPQPHADLVLGVDREVLRDADAAPGAERQVSQVVVLRQVLRRLAGDGDRRDRRAPEGQPADLAHRRDVALDEQRRHPQGVRDVVEAVSGIVGGQRADVGVDGQQVAHRVAILGAVHAVEQRASRVGARERDRIERRLQPGGEGIVRGPRGPRAPHRRHGPAAELLHHLLPQLRVGGDVLHGDLDRVQGKTGRPQPAVVTGHAVPLQQRRVGVARRRGGGAGDLLRPHRGRWSRRYGGASHCGGCAGSLLRLRRCRGGRGGLRRLGPGDAGRQTAGQRTTGQQRQHGASQEPRSPW